MGHEQKSAKTFDSYVLSPSVNNLLRGNPFSHEDKINEHVQES